MVVLDRYRKGRQPCDNLVPGAGEWFGHVSHVCPTCDGLRVFCETCCRDHHEGGWETCLPKVTKGDDNE